MKVRKRTYASGREAWQVDLGIIEGKRTQKAFTTKAEADAFCKASVEERKRWGTSALSLGPAERLRFAASAARLHGTGVTIEQAIDWALERVKLLKENLLLPELVKRYLIDRELNNKRERYVTQLGVSLGGFAAMYPEVYANDLTRDQIRKWMTSNGWAPKTQANYLGDLRGCVKWAMDHGIMTHNPCGSISVPSMDEKEVGVLTPEQCERLLQTAVNHVGRRFDRKAMIYHPAFVFRPLLGYIALAMFAGVRPEEVKRSPASAIQIESSTIVITGRRAKTRQRRVVDLSSNAVGWVQLWKELCPHQEMIVPKNFRKLWESLREAAKLKGPGWSSRRSKKLQVPEALSDWVPDVLRHTAATMHYGLHQNLALLQAQLGHSANEATLFRHYRAVEMPDGKPVTKKVAEQFYAIMPPTSVLTIEEALTADRSTSA